MILKKTTASAQDVVAMESRRMANRVADRDMNANFADTDFNTKNEREF